MERKLRILEILNESDSWIKGSELANLLGVSPRTIRNDIKEVKEQFTYEAILTSNTKGYKLNKTYLSNIKNNNIQYYTSQNERMILILKLLVLKEEGIDIYSLSEKLYISEHTLETHIYTLKKHIKSLNLENTKLVKRGSFLVLEANYIDRNTLFYDTSKILFKNIRLSDFQNIFMNIDLLVLYKIIREIVLKNHLNSRYISLKRLTIDIALIIEKEAITEKTLGRSNESDNISQQIKEAIIEKFDIELEQKKQHYISYKLFMILTLQDIEQKYRNGNSDDEFSQKIRTALKELGTLINVDLLKEEELVKKLITHLRITIERKKIGFKSPNPLIDNLKNECQFIFSLAIFIVDKLKLSLNVNDISYIVAYLLIIINENKQWYESDKLQVGIIVSDGLANLEYIANQVKLLDEKRQCTISKFSSILDMGDEKIYDIIISTSNHVLNYEKGMTINKEFTRLDRLRIRGTLDDAIKEKKKVALNRTIHSLIKEELFEINDTITKKEEAIKYLSQKLVKEGYVNEDFYLSVLKRESVISSRIESGVAIPHSYSYNSKKSAIAILVCKNGILWDRKRVKVVMLICLTKDSKEEFIKFSNEFNKILINNNICECALSCKNVYEFIKSTENFLMS